MYVPYLAVFVPQEHAVLSHSGEPANVADQLLTAARLLKTLAHKCDQLARSFQVLSPVNTYCHRAPGWSCWLLLFMCLWSTLQLSALGPSAGLYPRLIPMQEYMFLPMPTHAAAHVPNTHAGIHVLPRPNTHAGTHGMLIPTYGPC